MNRFSVILFDLDGTLTDSRPGILNSLHFALDHLGLRVPYGLVLDQCIGPPLADSFRTHWGLDADQVKRAIAAYRHYYTSHGIHENRLYPGIEGLLRESYRAGHRHLLTTGKPTLYARRILEHFRIDALFETALGSELDGSRTDKIELVECSLAILDRVPRMEIVLVGDREADVDAARACGIASIAVTYGYAQPGELVRARPDNRADSVAALRDLLI